MSWFALPAPVVFGALFVMPCVCLLAMLGGMWRLRTSNAAEVVIDVQPAMRVTAMMIGVFALLSVGIWRGPVGHQLGTLERVSLLALQSLTALVAAYMFWLAGPAELRFDLRHRTYSFRRGFLWQQKIDGDMGEIKAVHVCPVTWWGSSPEVAAVLAGNDNGQGVRVLLQWSGATAKRLTVSFRFGPILQARGFAERLASALALPLIEG